MLARYMHTKCLQRRGRCCNGHSSCSCSKPTELFLLSSLQRVCYFAPIAAATIMQLVTSLAGSIRVAAVTLAIAVPQDTRDAQGMLQRNKTCWSLKGQKDGNQNKQAEELG